MGSKDGFCESEYVFVICECMVGRCVSLLTGEATMWGQCVPPLARETFVWGQCIPLLVGEAAMWGW